MDKVDSKFFNHNGITVYSVGGDAVIRVVDDFGSAHRMVAKTDLPTLIQVLQGIREEQEKRENYSFADLT